jgi:hypothetical protein
MDAINNFTQGSKDLEIVLLIASAAALAAAIGLSILKRKLFDKIRERV